MHRIQSVASLCLLLALLAAPLQAGPIPVAPSPVPSAGESLLTSFIVGAASSINIDWEVIPTAGTAFPGGFYAYLYQVENTSASAGVDAFSITLSPNAIASLVGSGVLAGDNLDINTAFHLGHNVGNFPILATEQDPFPLQLLAGVNTTVDPIDDTVTWTFNPLTHGNQSNTLYYLSTLPPIYGDAVSQDSIPPSPWGSLALGGGQPVPVPTPEPSTLALAMIAVVGLLWHARRRFV